MAEAGYAYLGNGLSDDIPHYLVSDFAARRSILTLPYYYHFDDQFFLMFPRKGTGLEHAEALFANWVAEFNAQYRRGRFFNMVLHPGLIGWCNRVKRMEDFLNIWGVRRIFGIRRAVTVLPSGVTRIRRRRR